MPNSADYKKIHFVSVESSVKDSAAVPSPLHTSAHHVPLTPALQVQSRRKLSPGAISWRTSLDAITWKHFLLPGVFWVTPSASLLHLLPSAAVTCMHFCLHSYTVMIWGMESSCGSFLYLTPSVLHVMDTLILCNRLFKEYYLPLCLLEQYNRNSSLQIQFIIQL